MLMLLTGVLVVISFFSQLYFSNKYAVKGTEMTELMNKHAQLTKDISKLELAISEVSSLSLLETRAQQLGFVQMEIPVSVIKSPAVAVATDLQ